MEVGDRRHLWSDRRQRSSSPHPQPSTTLRPIPLAPRHRSPIRLPSRALRPQVNQTADLSTSLRSGRDNKFILETTLSVPKQTCHLDRSVAKWRDLRFGGPLLEMFFNTPRKGVILSEAPRRSIA